MAETILPVAKSAVTPRPLLGYAMAASAAALFGFNGTVAKVAIRSGVPADRLTEIRCAGALAGLATLAFLTSRSDLRIQARELAFLAAFGIGGVALVQWTYFEAIGRLPVGVALLIQYVAPLLVLLWARFAYREHVRRRVWAALALSLVGLVLVVRLWQGLAFDGLGLAAAAGSMVTFAFYLLLAERGVRRRPAVPLLAWGFAFATVFWSAILPWWSFPGGEVADRTSLLGRLDALHLPVSMLVLWVIVLGTVAPFALIVGSLRHVPATRVGIVAMLEPVTATLVAWAWLRESFGPAQLVGAVIVLVGIAVAQSAR